MPVLSKRLPFLVAIVTSVAATVPGHAATLAERIALCGTCHGEDGNSRTEKIPSLAGQPAFFVLNQLFLMREGVRQVPAMASFVKELKDEELDGLSKHYEALPAKPSGEPLDATLAKKGGEVANQRRCASCHQSNLAGSEQVPRLARQRVDYLVPTLKSYRDAPRPGADTAMSAAIAGATDDDLTALAQFAASQ